MRLFIGVTPPADAVAHLSDAVNALKPVEGLRWTDPSRWHVTLAFLGEVEAARISRLEDELTGVAATHAPIAGVRLAGAGTFGAVLWAAVTPVERGSALDQLARATQRAARRAGVDVERRPWRGHLTIGRSRGGAEPLPVARRLANYRGPAWTADAITLTHSILGPQPEHHALRRWDLSAERSQRR